MSDVRVGCVCLIASFCLVACQKNVPDSEPMPDVAGASPAEVAPAEASPAASARVVAPVANTLKSDAAIYAAIGCPADRITPSGCNVCPTGSLWQDVSDEREVTIALARGKTYSAAKGEHVMAVFSGCQDLGGIEQVTDYVHLVRGEDDEAWAIQSIASFEDLKRCDELQAPGGLTRHVCHTEGGRMGYYYGRYVALNWNKTIMQDGIEQPEGQVLVSTVYSSACQENYEVSDRVEMSLEDADGDGIPEPGFKVTHVEGPYEGELKDCFDGDGFEAPLTPTRTAKTSSLTLTYTPTPEGYVEASNQPPGIVVSEEYRQFIDG